MTDADVAILREPGRLLERLRAPQPEPELLRAAGEIIAAMTPGGSGEDLDDYAEAPELVGTFVDLMTVRAQSPHDFVAVNSIAWFLRDDDGWDDRLRRGWSGTQRQRLLAACERIMAGPKWPERAAAGLESADPSEFWAAERTAQALGIDTFDAHWRRLRSDPFGASWFHVMRVADEERIRQILDLAVRTLPLEAIAAGPAMALGVGAEFAPHRALDFILPDLRRFPGHGWPLIRAGLRSPVIRNRGNAVKALTRWPRSARPVEAVAVLRAAELAEPDEKTRALMNQALSGMAPF